MKEQKIIDGLNNLLSKNYDAERGYNNVAEKSMSPMLTAFCREKASSRYTFGHQIKDILREMEGDINKGTSIKGDLHNAWINFKIFFDNDREEAILEEIERGEEAAIKEYNEFLKMDLPHSIRRIISAQRNQIAKALNRVEVMEEVYT